MLGISLTTINTKFTIFYHFKRVAQMKDSAILHKYSQRSSMSKLHRNWTNMQADSIGSNQTEIRCKTQPLWELNELVNNCLSVPPISDADVKQYGGISIFRMLNWVYFVRVEHATLNDVWS